MFTGIITDLGRVRAVEARGDTRLTIETGYDTGAIDLGASIACSGACLTVVDKGPKWFGADVSAETLSKTPLGDWAPGTAVNLERALKLGGAAPGGRRLSSQIDDHPPACAGEQNSAYGSTSSRLAKQQHNGHCQQNPVCPSGLMRIGTRPSGGSTTSEVR